MLISTGGLLFNIFLNDTFFFLKEANLGNYEDDSTQYAYNKKLETVICNKRQEFSILSNWWQLYCAQSRKVSLHTVWGQREWAIWPDLQWYYTKTQQSQKMFRCNYWQ